jgi:general secretion pathway protein D
MRWIKILILFFAIAAVGAENKIQLNFKDLEITDFIKTVAKITHKNILAPARLKGKVNFVSVKPLKKNKIYNLLVAVLKQKGYTIVSDPGGFLMVVRSADARKEAPPFYGESSVTQIQTNIYSLDFFDSKRAYSSIIPMLSRYGKAQVVSELNGLIVTDFPKNLRKIGRIIKFLDQKEKKEIEFVSLKETTTNLLYSKLKKIADTLYPPKIKSQKVEVIPYDSVNTIILIAKKEQIKKLKSYIESLDKKDTLIKPVVNIVRLKNSDCKDMQRVLNNILARRKYEKNEPRPIITIDAPTNSLIIQSSQKTFDEIKNVIKSLDIEREQVYVKARIVEISTQKTKKVGIKYGLFGGTAGSSGLFTMSANLAKSGASAIAFDIDTLNIEKPTLSEGVALGATVTLLESEGAAKKLSEPSLLLL